MSDRALDRLLFVLLMIVLGTGPLTWRAGSAADTWVYWLHGIASGVLFVAVLMKLWRSLPRAVSRERWGRLSVAIPLAVLTLLALGTGFAWVAGGTLVE